MICATIFFTILIGAVLTIGYTFYHMFRVKSYDELAEEISERQKLIDEAWEEYKERTKDES